MSEVTEETIEVVAVKESAEKSHEEEIRMSNHGKLRQRKSSSSPTHDSCSIENECLQEKSASKKNREEKKKENEGKGKLCTVEYVKEIPEKLGLSESSNAEQNVMKVESRRSSEKSIAASDVRYSLEKTTRIRGDVGYDEKRSKVREQERKVASGPGNAKKQFNSAHVSTKSYPAPKRPAAEPLKKTDSKPGQALRKIISDPCLMNRPPFLAAHTRIDNIGQDSVTTQGQGLRRISSEPIHRPDTIYSPPIIKGSLKLDKKSLKELKSKIEKSNKSPAEIHKRIFESNKKDEKNKKFSPAALSFTNEIYGSIEELRAPESEPKATVFEECETEPIYEVIQEKRENNVGQDGKCESKEEGRKEVKDSLQNTKEKSSKRKNRTKKGSKISKPDYEPRMLDFKGSSEDSAHLQPFSSPTEVEESHEKHEKCFENLSFSILEDLEEFDEDFDEEPNNVVDRVYQDVEEQVRYAKTVHQ